MEETPKKSSFWSKYSKKQKISIIVAGALVVAGIAGCTTYAILNSGSSKDDSGSSVILSNNNETITLSEGTNKIKSGGTYTITGSISNGKITVDTDENVKLILKSVSIKNSDGAAIKCKGTGTVIIEFQGENTLTSSGTEDPAATISSEGTLEILGDGSVKISSTGKGIKAETKLTVSSGIFDITSEDDALHTNGSMQISGGTYTVSTGDDAFHADVALTVDDGKITVSKCSEGLEAVTVTVNGGDISITASDDGINANNSNGSSVPGNVGDGALTITGGKVYVNSGGDGLDSNGSISISGGEIYVDGPTSSADGAIDCDGAIKITGGTLIAVGASGMAQNATEVTQPSVLMNLSGNYSGELSFGGITYKPSKSYQSVLISSPNLKTGETYTLTIGGQTVRTVEVSSNIAGDQGGGMGGMGGGMRGGMMNQQGGNAPDAESNQQGGQQMPDRSQGNASGGMRGPGMR